MNIRPTLLALAAGALPPTLASQNASLLSRLDTRSAYAGVWGYTAPDGREFALVGERSGTWIVETTDPTAPVQVGFFSAPSSTWREITGFGPYVYSVSENHGGIRVIDMTNPGSPADLGTVHGSTWSNTHSISVDPDAKRLYANGTRNGMYILDLSVNPASPTVLGRYTDYYVHDCYVRRGKGYLAQINSGNLRIMDVTNPSSFTPISSTQTPGNFTHNVWVTDDDQLMVTTDENSTGFLQVYDISNPAAPQAKGSYVVPGAIVHNAFLMGRTAYIAHYSDGFHMVDVSNPDAPKRLARYDTSTSTGGFNGDWGAYPFQDSGVIYASDRANGLFCLQMDCGHMNRFGKATPGTGGAVARLTIPTQAPAVGATGFQLQVTGAAPNSVYVLLIGAKGSLQALGIDLYVDVTQSVIALVGVTSGTGAATIPLGIGNDPSLANVRAHAQVITVDAGGPQGLAASRGHWFGICP
jgi:choice-of-anchor B domain-containing protein